MVISSALTPENANLILYKPCVMFLTLLLSCLLQPGSKPVLSLSGSEPVLSTSFMAGSYILCSKDKAFLIFSGEV